MWIYSLSSLLLSTYVLAMEFPHYRKLSFAEIFFDSNATDLIFPYTLGMNEDEAFRRTSYCEELSRSRSRLRWPIKF